MELKVAIVTSICSLVGVVITAICNTLSNKGTHNKMLEVSNLTLYRIEQLEKKQDKHNNLIERIYKIEEKANILDEKIKVANHRIEDLEERSSDD